MGARIAALVATLGGLASCGFPRPPRVGEVDDAGADALPGSCTPGEVLHCDGADLIRCNADGVVEAVSHCAISCEATQRRCIDIAPSNMVGPYLDMTDTERDLDLGATATIDTDTGAITADGASLVVSNVLLTQSPAPTIRVLIVHGLVASDVTVTGKNALAIVSAGDIAVRQVLSASARYDVAGPGAFNDGSCVGGDPGAGARALSGAGGGGFGFAGGQGGAAGNVNGTVSGGAAGLPTGNAPLIPLRGGCDSGKNGSTVGGGGGAIQLVSRTRISVSGVIAANGSSFVGGGSGGGILLEAPIVEVTGNVVANGGAGAGGCLSPERGEAGRLDATPAAGGIGCASANGVNGGDGGARNAGAGNGHSVSLSDNSVVLAGHGGGGAGRIRVNTVTGGFRSTGLFSPNPSTGTIGTR